jgi:hypothetical protein
MASRIHFMKGAGMTDDEIAAALGVDRRTAQRAHQRHRRYLRAELLTKIALTLETREEHGPPTRTVAEMMRASDAEHERLFQEKPKSRR